MPPETQRQNRGTRRIRFLRNKCYDGEDYGPAYDQQEVDAREDWAQFFVRRGDAEFVEEDEGTEAASEEVAEEDTEPGAPTFDTVSELEEAIAEVDDPDEVRAIRDAEANGSNQVTAIEACEERIAELEDES